MTDTCPTCRQAIPKHYVGVRNVGGHETYGIVDVHQDDPSDPFLLLDPPPAPFTDAEALAAIRSQGELESDGQLERWEATRRGLVEALRKHGRHASLCSFLHGEDYCSCELGELVGHE